MNALKVLNENFEAKNNSFLYYLHEENFFHEAAFAELCDSLFFLCDTHGHDKVVSARICFIYGQVLKHIMYHFDLRDMYRIQNLPDDYNEKIEMMEHAVQKYFSLWNLSFIVSVHIGRGVNFSIEADHIEQIYQRVVRNQYPIFRPMMTSKYESNGKYLEQKEFLVQDPDGYLLRFTHE